MILSRSPIRFLALSGAVIAALWLAASPARALEADAARGAVETLHEGLRHIMENGPDLGLSGRAAYMEDVVDEAYNLRALTAQAIGPSTFRGFTGEEQARLVDAYRTFVVANYASRFKAPSPVGFETQDVTDGPGPSLVVNTTLGRRSGDPVKLSYIVTENADGKAGIADVLYDGVSESARRRSEFGSLAAKGADALERAIRVKAEEIAAESE